VFTVCSLCVPHVFLTWSLQVTRVFPHRPSPLSFSLFPCVPVSVCPHDVPLYRAGWGRSISGADVGGGSICSLRCAVGWFAGNLWECWAACHTYSSKETYYSVKKDLLQHCNVTVKRDLLQCQKRPIAVRRLLKMLGSVSTRLCFRPLLTETRCVGLRV
jgi:hypothetical protein